MTKKLAGVAVGVALCLSGVAVAQQAKPMPPAAATPDYAALAEKLVGTNAGVKEGQVVWIVGGPLDLALAEELAVAVRKRGAYPLVQYVSEPVVKKMLATVPAKYDGQTRKVDIALAKLADVVIHIPQVRDQSIYNSIPTDRVAAMAKAEMQGPNLMAKRKIRYLDLDNDLAPSTSRAKERGISEAEMKKIWWDGLTADYASVEQKCGELGKLLAKGKELKVTHPNGTDLTIAIKPKTLTISDGVISDADVKSGKGVMVWLPAGEVATVTGTSSGTLVDDRSLQLGKEVIGLRFEIKAGKITNLSAKSGWDGLPKERYDAAGPRKGELSLVNFGCNSAMKADKLESYIAAGMLTIIFGNNAQAGGTNNEAFNMMVHLPGTTVTLDGKPLIENGALK